jgi:hypothetical protein
MRKRFIGLSALIVVLALGSAICSAQALDDVTAQMAVTKSGLVLNRKTLTFDCLVTITNNSGATINSPLALVISNISQSTVLLANKAGSVPQVSGNPYVNVAVPSGGLLPGASVSNVLLKFSNANRLAFTFSTSVLIQTTSLVLSAPPGLDYTYQCAVGGGCSMSTFPITFSITNNGPFPATNVKFGFTSYEYVFSQDYSIYPPYAIWFSSLTSPQGTCSVSGGEGAGEGAGTCTFPNLAVGASVVIGLLTTDLDGENQYDLKSSATCDQLNAVEGTQESTSAATRITPVFSGFAGCGSTQEGCTQMADACHNVYTNALNSCDSTYMSVDCTVNGNGLTSAESAACSVAGYFGGWAAQLVCQGAACEERDLSCQNDADSQAVSCLDNVWYSCYNWAQTYCGWCTPYPSDLALGLGSCSSSAPTQLPTVW